MNTGKTRISNVSPASAQNKGKGNQGKVPTPAERNALALAAAAGSPPQQPEPGLRNLPQEVARKRPNASNLSQCTSKTMKLNERASDLPEDEILERRRNRKQSQAQLATEDDQDYDKLATILKSTRKELHAKEAHYTDKINKLQNSFDNLKTHRDILHQKVTSFDGDMKHLKETLILKDEIIEKMEGIQTLSQENIKAKEKEIEKLKAELVKLRNSNEQNEKAVCKLREELSNSQKQVKALQDEYEMKKQAIKTETQKEFSRIWEKF